MRVLGTDEFTMACSLHERVSPHRIIVRLSDPLPPGACIRIDCDDALLLGDVLGGWRQGSSIFAVIELRQALAGLAELKSICDDVGYGSDERQYAQRLSA